MKVSELAAELKMSSKEIIEKAESMGIEAKIATSNLSEMDATAIKNAILAKRKKDSETKIVKVSSKKSEDDDNGLPKTELKTAKVSSQIPKKADLKKPSSAKNEGDKAYTKKPPVGKPVPKASSGKVPAGKPVPKKSAVAKKAEEELKAAGKTVVKKENIEKDSVEKKSSAESLEKKRTVAPAKPEIEKEANEKKKVTNKNPDRRPVREVKVIKSAEEQKAEAKAAEERKRETEAAQKEKLEKKKKRAEKKISDTADAGVDKQKKASGGSRKNKDREKDRNKFERMEKEKHHPSIKSLEKKSKKKHIPKAKPEPIVEEPEEVLPVGTKVVNVPITIAGFCDQVEVSVSTVIMTLLKMGIIANQNQNLDDVTVATLADELGIQVVIGNVEEEVVEEGLETFEDRESDLKARPPIITVMGHVDHGKTSLLDAIRNTDVTAGESGGITQHIGVSEVEINDHRIVFLDTPGHEAFTAMRARGANITDIAVLVVAADDSVKPQTIESISHAKAAGVPVIVAINKMDKPGANPDRVKQDLTEHGIVVEEWSGDVICVPVSAKTGDGIRNLLEMILLQAEVLELKANPDRLAMGTVVEARLDKAKGPVATLLVTNGTLKAGQSVVVGTCSGRIRLMSDYKGKTIRKAGPATAVEILGLTDVPVAGDGFNAVGSDKKAKEIAENRRLRQREELMARTSSSTLEELFSQIQEGERKELNLIIKGDVMGSVGAVTSSLEKLSNEDVKVNIIHSGAGAINESDVTLAGTSDAIIIGFNVRPSAAVVSMAERESVQIRTYSVIYNIIDDIENAMKGMLDPEFIEVQLGEVEVRDTFKVPGIGTIAGGYVTSGKIVRNAGIRLIRDGIVIHEGKISSLKRFKDDAKEVMQGYECGIGIEDYNDIKVEDIIECYEMQEVERS